MRSFGLFTLLLVACGSSGSGSDGGTDASADVQNANDGGDAGDAGAALASRCVQVASDPQIKQALPTATVDTTMPVLAGKHTAVKSGDSLQAAIDAAQPGDTLELAAGATFTGPITLGNKGGTDWIVIRTSTPDAQFAMPGTRVSPALAPKMAKIQAASTAITVAKGANHYRLIGLEVTATTGTYINAAVDLSVTTTSEADLAHDIVLDRVYLHADPVGARRGVALNSKSTAVIDSYISGFREQGADSQAIAGWTGSGPFLIANNYLEGASENVMFGGSDPSIQNLVPSDIQICGNHLKKDVSWKGGGWVVKNLFELKNARRVLAAGNLLEYNWADGQVGFAVLLTPRNQDGTAPWSGVEDVTFAYNVVRHTGSGFNALNSDDTHPSIGLNRALVQNNLWDDIDSSTYGGDGRDFQYVYGAPGGTDLKIDHNTSTMAQNASWTLGDTAKYGTNTVFTNNIVAHGTYGVFGGGQGEGQVALDFYLVSYTFDHNAIFGGGTPSKYPPNNFFPATQNDVGFASDFSLTSTSSLKGAGNDGKDVGADIPGVLAATQAAP
jgi:hypothetical protein